jgi:hypothetical protein
MKNPLKVLRAERNWTQADLADGPWMCRGRLSTPLRPASSMRACRSRSGPPVFGLRIEEIFRDDDRRGPATESK